MTVYVVVVRDARGAYVAEVTASRSVAEDAARLAVLPWNLETPDVFRCVDDLSRHAMITEHDVQA